MQEIAATEPFPRLDQFLVRRMPEISRARLQAWIRGGHVLLNGVATKPGIPVRHGDRVRIDPPAPVPDEALPEEIALAVLYEDEALVVLDKPAGLVVHPAAGHSRGTLVNALLHHAGGLSSVGGRQRPGIVHRLDKDTSGCLVAAKTDAAHHALARQFAGREVTKIYLALAEGVPARREGTIEAPIGRDPKHRQRMAVVAAGKGKTARTEYRVLAVLGSCSLVQCRLHTGRTHQIRVHLKHLGHPLCGDPLYGRRAAGTFPRQMLHAWRLGFNHPSDGRYMEFRAALPDDFLRAGVSPDHLSA